MKPGHLMYVLLNQGMNRGKTVPLGNSANVLPVPDNIITEIRTEIH